MKVRVSPNGWIVIPALLRAQYGIEPGQDVEIRAQGPMLTVAPETDSGYPAPPWPGDNTTHAVADGVPPHPGGTA